MFDDASVLDCYRRAESIVPQQALALENSPLANEMAKQIERRISLAKPGLSDAEFAKEAFLTVLAAQPTPDELNLVNEAIVNLAEGRRMRANRANPALLARIGLIQALLNHNDFVTVR